jgi:hypothetical protein
MYQLKKDLAIPQHDGSSAVNYFKDKNSLGLVYQNIDPNQRSGSVVIAIYNEQKQQTRMLDGTNINFGGDKTYIAGQTIEGNMISDFFPELTKKGLDTIKQLSVADGKLGDWM